MKSILISIKPKWVAKILNGEKTIEIRKTMPKCELPIDVYIYCTWGTGKYHQMMKQFGEYHFNKNIGGYCGFNGKVVAKFTLNKIEEIKKTERHDIELLEKSCLTATELYDYLLNKQTFNNVIGYAWYITNLEIFDKPKELSEFRHYKRCVCYNADFDYTTIEYRAIGLTKSPQSWQFVEVLE